MPRILYAVKLFLKYKSSKHFLDMQEPREYCSQSVSFLVSHTTAHKLIQDYASALTLQACFELKRKGN